MRTEREIVRVRLAPMENLIHAVMKHGGCTDAEAHTVAKHLVGANLSGHDSHGVIRIIRYHEWLKEGVLNGDTPPRTVLDTPALVQLDGERGIGQHLAHVATEIGIERAKTHGAAIVALRRAGHVGRLGHYAEEACAAGIASVQFVNVTGSLLVAPYGAAERCHSTNPVAVGVPHAAGDDFILDFATSMVAEGKALVAAQGGKPLPETAVVAADGTITGDPAALYGDSVHTDRPDARQGTGALRAMGEHKGSGLALACELLAGALTGNGTNGTAAHPFGNGWLGIFVDPARLDDTQSFAAEASAYIRSVHAARPAAGIDRVRIPGDVERETRAERRANGLPLAPQLLSAIIATGRAAGVGVDERVLVAG